MKSDTMGLDGSRVGFGKKASGRVNTIVTAVFISVTMSVIPALGEELRTEAWIDAARRMPMELAASDNSLTTNSLTIFGNQPEEEEEEDDGKTTFSDQSNRNPYAVAGSWRWAIYTGGAFDIQRDGEQYNLHFAASYFFRDDFNISMEAGALYFNQPNNSSDTFGFNFNFLMRWHFIKHDNWTMYGDAGAGFLLAGDEIPEGGTSYDFTPQAGVGFSFRINDEKDIWILTGLRWHHISNANINGSNQNPGRDSFMAYVGIDFPF